MDRVAHSHGHLSPAIHTVLNRRFFGRKASIAFAIATIVITAATGLIVAIATSSAKAHNLWQFSDPRFSNVSAVVVGPSGEIVVASAQTSSIFRLRPDGLTVDHIVAVDRELMHGQPNSCQLNRPNGVAVARNGDIYVADTENHRVVLISRDGSTAQTVIGGVERALEANGRKRKAQPITLRSPHGIALGPNREIAIADTWQHRIVVLRHDHEVLHVIGTGEPGLTDGPIDQTQFRYPNGVAFNAAGDIFVADTDNHRVRKIAIATQQVTTIAGQAGPGLDELATPVSSSKLRNPTHVAVADNGASFVADTINDRVRVILDRETRVTTVAGFPPEVTLGNNGSTEVSRRLAVFNPTGLAVTPEGGLLIAQHGKLSFLAPSDPLETRLTQLVSNAIQGNAASMAQLIELAQSPPLQDLTRSLHQNRSSLFSRLVPDIRDEVSRYVQGINTIRARLALHAALSGA